MMNSTYAKVQDAMRERGERVSAYGCTPRQHMTIGAANAAAPEDVQRERGYLYGIVGNVAVVPVIGPLCAFDWLGRFVLRALQVVRADADVAAVVFDIDSPGGDVAGWSDIQAQLVALAAEKPTYALAHDSATSLAYWFALHASELAMTPTAVVGHIGTAMAMFDTSEHDTKEGYRTVLLASSERKGVGLPGLPITPELTDDRRAVVDHFAASFFADVSRARGLAVDAVRELDARIYGAGNAVAMRLADRVVGANEYIAEIVEKHRAGGTVAATSVRPAATAAITATAISATASTEEPNMADTDEMKKKDEEIAALKAKLDEAEKAKAEYEKKEEEEEMAAASTAPAASAATFAELQAAFPKDPAFIVEAMSKGLTLAAATMAHKDKTIADLQARVAASSNTTIPARASTPTASAAASTFPVFASARDAFAQHPFRLRVNAICEKTKCGVAAAILTARQEDPASHADYLAQTQPPVRDHAARA